MKTLLLLLCVALSACSSWTPPRENHTVYRARLNLPGARASSEATEFLYADSVEVKKAVEEFRLSGRAPIIKKAGFLQYPFGESEPVMRCAPYRGCDIELQAGEEILGVVLGDPLRWSVAKFFSGSNGALVPHLIVKPVDFGISSNIVIGTNKRTYYLGLLSKRGQSVRRFKFYYPNDVLSYSSSPEAIARLTSDSLEDSPRTIYSKYLLRGAKDSPFLPTKIFDDGAHVYIEFDEKLTNSELPSIFVLRPGSKKSKPNWRIKGTTMIIDGVFNEAYLDVGLNSRNRVEIKRERP